MADNKTAFDYILEGIGNLPGSMGKIIADTPNVFLAPGVIIDKAAEDFGEGYKQGGVTGGLKASGKGLMDVGANVVKETTDFYSKPGAAQRMADDPARVLMDASGVLSGVGALSKVAGMGKVAKVANVAANIDPFSLVLEATKAGLRKADAPQWLYERTMGVVPGLSDEAKRSLATTANQRGYRVNLLGNKSKQALDRDFEILQKARNAATDKLTKPIPFSDLLDMVQEGHKAIDTRYGPAEGVADKIKSAKGKLSDFLYGTDPGGLNRPTPEARGGRNTTGIAIDPSLPIEQRIGERVLTGKEVAQEVIPANNRNMKDAYENRQTVDPDNTKIYEYGQLAADAAKRNYINRKLGPNSIENTTQIPIGKTVNIRNRQPGMPYFELRYPKNVAPKTDYLSAGREQERIKDLSEAHGFLKSPRKSLHSSAIEASNALNPTAYGSTFTALDFITRNPIGMTNTAAAINNKTRGPIAKGLRGARRTLFQLNKNEQPQMQEQQEEQPLQEPQVLDNPFRKQQTAPYNPFRNRGNR